MVPAPRRSWLTAVALSASLVVGTEGLIAQDESPKKAPAASGDAAPGEGKKSDPLVAPEGNDAKALTLYLTRVMRARPMEPTDEAIARYLENVRAAGELILSRDVDDDELLGRAASLQLQALEALSNRGDVSAEAKLEKLKESLAKDKRPAIVAVVEVSSFETRLAGFEEMPPADQKKLVGELAAKLSAPKIIPDYVPMTRTVGMMYESLDRPDEAKAALNLFADRLEERKGDDPQLAVQIKQFISSLRSTAKRLDLIGRPIDIKGSSLSGEPFNIASLKGKVVLVDFWATWCGPCLQEMPNVVRHYNAYHDKGFVVVGISLDESEEELKEFVKDRKIPWVNLFDENPDNQGWNNPIARTYGISGIPACILVDQKGNVVSLNARGPKLGQLLQKLLGPADVKEEGSEEEK